MRRSCTVFSPSCRIERATGHRWGGWKRGRLFCRTDWWLFVQFEPWGSKCSWCLLRGPTGQTPPLGAGDRSLGSHPASHCSAPTHNTHPHPGSCAGHPRTVCWPRSSYISSRTVVPSLPHKTPESSPRGNFQKRHRLRWPTPAAQPLSIRVYRSLWIGSSHQWRNWSRLPQVWAEPEENRRGWIRESMSRKHPDTWSHPGLSSMQGSCWPLGMSLRGKSAEKPMIW